MRIAVFVAVLLTAHSAAAQIDISGNWASSQENYRPRGNAGIGDYTGLPLNDAGRLRADTWDASVLSQRERQAQPHPTQYAGSTPIGGLLIVTLSNIIGVSETLLICAALCLLGIGGAVVYRRRTA